MSSEITYFKEEEAITKLCPYRDSECKASSCMKWVWFYKKVPYSPIGTLMPPPKLIKTDMGGCGA